MDKQVAELQKSVKDVPLPGQKTGGQMVTLDSGVSVELLQGPGGVWRGLGRVEIDGFPLRSAKRPILPLVRTPEAVELTDLRVRKQEVGPGRVCVELEPSLQHGGLMDWMVHTVRNRIDTSDWSLPPQRDPSTTLSLTLEPVTRTIGGHAARGLRYQMQFASEHLAIYRILDRATWEPSGHAVGNSVWMRGCFHPSIADIRDVQQGYFTGWHLPNCPNPDVFQFMPLQTELQGFTFTVNRRGVLVTWATQVAHVRTLLEKSTGEDLLVHWHEHCGDLAREFATSPVEVLWIEGQFDRVGLFNLYEAVRDLVHTALHEQLGMRPERITTSGIIEEWGPVDMPAYTDKPLQAMIDAGVKRVEIANQFENNMNTWGVSNMCCTVDYKIAESVGEANFAAFCAKARAAGIRVSMWGNTSISTLTEIFSRRNGTEDRIRFLPVKGSILEVLAKAQQPFVRNPSGAIEADHYTPQFAVLNLRDPLIREYWMKCWKHAADLGLGAIFLDSSFNLSSDKFTFIANVAGLPNVSTVTTPDGGLPQAEGPTEHPSAILSQYRAHLDLMTQMQQIGYEYTNEDLGVFGLHRHGPTVGQRLDSLPLWGDCLTGFDAEEISAAGGDPGEVYFRGLAYRMVWVLRWDFHRGELCWVGRGDKPTVQQLQLLGVYNQVQEFMQQRTILPGETAVVYGAGQTRVIWAFAATEVDLGGECNVKDVLTGQQTRTQRLKCQPRTVYLVTR